MKTRRKRMTGPVMIGLLMLPCALHAQVTVESNNILSNEYVGCDANSNQPLRFSTLANYRHEWRTNNVFRMRLTQTLTGQTINGFGGLDLSGHLGVGPFSGNVNRPFSMIHIDNGGDQVSGFRPWFKTGLTLTRGTDLGYVGLKDEGNDLIHMTVCWADNTLVQGPDLLKFIFLAQPIMANGIVGTLNGLEAARVCPAPDGNESFYGIGDWFTTGNDVNPDERLDILDRTIRIRRLVPDYEDPTLERVVVTDDDGRLHWRPLTGLADCASGWTLNGANPVTAYNGNPCPPQAIHQVGIGTLAPLAKLHVVKNLSNGIAEERGAFIQNSLSNVTNYGLDAWATGAESGWNYGVRGFARNAGRTYGVYGRAFSGTGVHAHGMYGLATGSTINEGAIGQAHDGVENYGGSFVALGQSNSLLNYGVNASASGPMTAVNYAGYFAGDVYATGMYLPSDEILKTNVNEVDALDHGDPLNQLRLYTYQYDQESAPGMNLPQGDQLGLMASDLEELFPGLVKRSIQPAVLDTLGAMVHPPVEFTAVNYQGLIPYLILVQQQQAHRLATLEQALASCCSPSDNGSLMQGPMDSEGKPKMDPAMERLLRIDPNPFTDATTVRYTLERAGRAQLLVNSSDGKQLQVLHEGLASAGDHSYDWNTGHLAPGVYYVTLLLDGAPLVKRAVKVR